MEPKPPSRSTPPPPVGGPRPPAEGTAQRPGGEAAPPADEPPVAPANGAMLLCPVCSEPRAADARFCEECGHDYGNEPPPPAPAVEERPRLSGPLLWLVIALWAVLAVAGLYFLYTVLWAI